LGSCKQLLNAYSVDSVKEDKELLFAYRIWMMLESILYAVFVIINFEDIEDNDLRFRLAIISFVGVILTWIIYIKDMIGINKVKKIMEDAQRGFLQEIKLVFGSKN